MPPVKKSEKEEETQPQEETVEVAVKEEETQPQDGQENDLSPEEQEMAKKHGLITEQEDKTVIKVDDKNPSAVKKAPAQQQPAAQPIDLEKRQEIKQVVDMDLSLEEEKEVLKTYDANSKALYFRMKKNIKQRQAAEHRANELAAANARLEEELKTFKTQPKPVKPQQEDDDIFSDMEDDDVLTVADAKAKLAARKAAAQKQPIQNNPDQPPATVQTPENQEAIRRQAEATVATLAQQEEEFRASHEDFDAVLVNSKNIMTMVNKAMSKNQDQSVIGELELEETFGSDRKTILQAKRLSVEFSSILAKGGIDEFGRTAAEVAYELGQLISVPSDTPAAKPKGTETVGKDKIAKIIANVHKSKSPASVTGSGTVKIPLSQLTAEDLQAMSSEEYAKVPKDVRDRILRNC